jgi:hypothetical protein
MATKKNGASVLTADQILGADDIKKEFVSTPEWADGSPDAGVYVRGLTGFERDAFEDAITERKGKNVEVNISNIRAELAIRAACDAEGKLIFTPEQVEALGKKNARPLDGIFSVAQRLSGITSDDVQELAKN